MKIYLILIGLLCIGFSASAQNDNPQYDSTLAKQYGADEYGMKMYTFIILKTGGAKVESKEERSTLFRGHMDNINRLVEEKKLIIAGPFGENDNDFRGLFILDVPTVEEAEALLETDPAIHAKLLKAEIYPWYGSAALPAYLPVSEKVSKKNP
jgi:uncharacterized protein YciI